MANNNNLKINLKWRRPESIEYPKVWHRFMGRDLDSDNLVEYRIEDVTASNAKDVLKHMKTYFLRDEPLSCALGCANDELYYEDYKIVWDAAIDQKTPLVCYKAGSDEIVGAHMTFVESKTDNYTQQVIDSCRSDRRKQKFELFKKLSSSFCPFQYYGVDVVLAELGLSVNRKYRGREIGVEILATHKLLCKEYGLNVAHGSFTSEYSDACADKVGFVTNTAARYEDYLKRHPEQSWMQNIKVKQFSKRSLLI